MKRFYLFSIVLFSVLITTTLASCTPASGAEPAVTPLQPSIEEDSAGSGLATVLPAEAQEEAPQSTAPGDFQELDAAIENNEDTVVDEEIEQSERNEAVTPAVVDLSKITPQPPAEGETLREIPAPGIPNPSVAASNRASIDLADTLGIDVSDVEIVSVTQVEWPDSSLGCPKAGQSYLMVITPGFRVVLEANGQEVEYHTNIDGTILAQCGNGAQSQNGTVER